VSSTGIAAGLTTAAGVVAALGVMAAPAAGAHVRSQPAGFTVVADHLSNPRGLWPAAGGGLYLAEAGSGGNACVTGGPQGTTCFGLTGSFDVVGRGGIERIVTGLISSSGPGGVAAEGAVSVSAAPGHGFFGLVGLNTHRVPPKGAIPGKLRSAALAQLGRLWMIKAGRSVQNVSNVGDQDWRWAKHHIKLAPKDFPDANPNDVLYSRGRRYVADAGANTLVEVIPNGRARVLSFFGVPANSQSDSVASCVARGPDGALYVGELLGGFYSPGHARIWRIAPGHAPQIWATGLTTVQGCGFGSDGAFYATELQTSGFGSPNPAGDVVRISRNGHRTHLGVGKLFFPSGFAPGADGAIYVSNCSVAPATGLGPGLCPTGGQVVRIA
jgi:hypothetical protein